MTRADYTIIFFSHYIQLRDDVSSYYYNKQYLYYLHHRFITSLLNDNKFNDRSFVVLQMMILIMSMTIIMILILTKIKILIMTMIMILIVTMIMILITLMILIVLKILVMVMIMLMIMLMLTVMIMILILMIILIPLLFQWFHMWDSIIFAKSKN